MLNRYKSEQGQAIVLIAIVIIGLVGITALAVDGGAVFVDKRHAQSAADAAAFAAALAKIKGNDTYNAGYIMATNNGYDNDGLSNVVSIHNPPISGSYTGNDEYIQVIITSNVNTSFAPVVGVEEITNSVEAVARAKPATRQEMFSGNAMVALAESDRGLEIKGSPEVTTIGGGIFVNSSSRSALFVRGASTVTAPSINVVGGVSIEGAVTIVPTPTTGVEQINWPMDEVVWPQPSCAGNATQNGDSLSPGRYNGTFPPRNVQFLEPGVYCINGDFRLVARQSITGSDVLIYMESGDIWWDALAEINISAPTSGPYQGLLIYYMPPDDPCSSRRGRPDVMINGRASSTFTGTVFAPSANVHITGRGNLDAYHSQFIGCTIEATGNSELYIQYDDIQNYDVIIPPKIELAQ
ncbi:MAG: pilus assembly protein TadG-related protein [Anaerolineales bacterium]|nr:pilus assembly protein TadG-related protein [Anaerolineales bacterium]